MNLMKMQQSPATSCYDAHTSSVDGSKSFAAKTSPARGSSICATNATEKTSSLANGFVYSTFNTIWSTQELQLLLRGLDMFPEEKYDNITRYLNIASMIPTKCTRDVASKIKRMSMQRDIGQANDSSYSQPHKRMRIEQYYESNGLHHKENHLYALLQENSLMLHAMRNHLLQNQCEENQSIMLQFHHNCQTVSDLLSTLSNSLPPLPLKIDTSLIAGALSVSENIASSIPTHA